MLGLITVNSQVSIASHEESNSEDKKSDSNNDKSDTTTPPTDDNKQSTTTTDTPSVGNVVIPLQQGTTTTVTATCSDCSNHNDDRICTAETNQEQTVSQSPSTPTPQVNPIVNTNPSNNPSTTTTTIEQDNQKAIDNIIAAGQNSDTSGSNSGSSSGKSDNSETSDNEEKNIFPGSHDKNLGSESRFIIMQQDNEKVGLFQIISNEDNMSVNILPKTIRPILEYDNVAEALQHIQEIDNRSN
jgi:hypothetical protein